jgi:hypothetical protein
VREEMPKNILAEGKMKYLERLDFKNKIFFFV